MHHDRNPTFAEASLDPNHDYIINLIMSTSRTSLQMIVFIYYFPHEHARFEVVPVAEKPVESNNEIFFILCYVTSFDAGP